MPRPMLLAAILALAGALRAGWLPEERLSVRPDTGDFTTQNNARTVASDDNGNIHVVWYGKHGPQSQVWYSRRDAPTGDWTRDTVISSEPTGACYPSIAADDSGNAHVIWQVGPTSNGTALRYRRWTAAIREWGKVETIVTGTHVERPSIAARNSNLVVAAWEQQWPGAYRYVFAASRDASGWSQPELASMAWPTNQGSASVGLDASGTTSVLWRQSPNLIMFRQRSDSGWKRIDTVFSGSSEAPCMWVEANGAAHCIWTASPSGRQIQVYRQRRTGMWGDTVALPVVSNSQEPVSLCTDAFGHLHAVWESRDSIYYTTADSTGENWSVPLLIAAAARARENPTLSAGPGSDAQVVWTDHRHEVPAYCPDVYCRRKGLIRDVAAGRIVRPVGTVDSGTVVVPAAWVHNLGEMTEVGVRAWFRAGPDMSARVIGEILPGDSVLMEFDSCMVVRRGWNVSVCSTYLAGDVIRANDIVRDSFFVRVRDVSADTILSPCGLLPLDTIRPRATVRNRGNVAAACTLRFHIICDTGLVYADTKVMNLAPDTTALVQFRAWPGWCGRFTACCSVACAGDMHPENDARSQQFDIYWWDVGVPGIHWPPVNIDSGVLGRPAAVLSNFGCRSESFRAFFSIGRDYAHSFVVESLGPGQDTVVEFSEWKAVVRDRHPVTCSLYCPGDMNRSNDTQRCSVFVCIRDVSSDSILSPAGLLPLDTVRPRALVRNRGNVAAEVTSCFTITHGDSLCYSDTLACTLQPGSVETLTFRPWLGRLGTFSARCSAAYSGDMHPENNVRTQQFELYWWDVGLGGLVWPPTHVDSGEQGRPSVHVHNNGSRPEDFRAWMGIGTGFLDSLDVRGLEPDRDTVLFFTNWQSMERGLHPAVCSLACAGDMDPGNDLLRRTVFVRVRDVATETILCPRGLLRAEPVRPGARVANFGNDSAHFLVQFRVEPESAGNAYCDSAEVTVAAGSSEVVEFREWCGAPGGYFVSCSTALAGDMSRANDRASCACTLRLPDVRVLRVVWPPAVVDSGALGCPEIEVANLGPEPASFQCVFGIEPEYVDTVAVDSLAPGRQASVRFTEWYAMLRGWHPLRCTIVGAGPKSRDAEPCSVFVRVTDAAVRELLSPRGNVGRRQVRPRIRAANCGNEPREVRCWFRVGADTATVYLDSLAVPMGPESETMVEFASWDAASGVYSASAWSVLEGDMRPGNDTASAAVSVLRADAALVMVQEPRGIIRPGRVAPQVRVANLGEAAADIWVRVIIADSVPVYEDSALLAGFRPAAETVAVLREWDAAVGCYLVSGSVVVEGDEDPGNDTGTAVVVVESLVSRRWSRLADVPVGRSNRPVRDGGCVVALADGLFCLKGGGSDESYRYWPARDSWTATAPVPVRPGGRTVKSGAAMCADAAGRVFTLKGNRTPEFLAYDSGRDSWAFLPQLPRGTRLVKHGAGLAYVADDTGRVFMVKASGTLDFLVYWVKSRQWHARRWLPSGPSGRPARRGTCLASVGKRLFCLKGGTGEFYEYFPARDSWARRANLPEGASGRSGRTRDGAALCADGSRYLYAFKGRCGELWRYDGAQDSWEELPAGIPGSRVGRGGSLAWLGGRVYGVKGNSTRELWLYDPQADEPALVVPESGRGQVEQGQPEEHTKASIPGADVSPWSSRAVRVYDATGRLVRCLPATVGRPALPELRPGVYFVASGPGRVRKLTVAR